MRHLVASGRLGPGAALPSVRDLAREQRINPNTVAKAYQRLAAAGVVEARRGRGDVRRRPPARPVGRRRGRGCSARGPSASRRWPSTIGASAAEAVKALEAAWPDDRRTKEDAHERRRSRPPLGPRPRDGRAHGRLRPHPRARRTSPWPCPAGPSSPSSAATAPGRRRCSACLLGQRPPPTGRVRLLGAGPLAHRRRLMARVGVVPEEPDALPGDDRAPALGLLRPPARPLGRGGGRGAAPALRRADRPALRPAVEGPEGRGHARPRPRPRARSCCSSTTRPSASTWSPATPSSGR